MKKRYVICWSPEERERLGGWVHRGREAAYRRRHARVLLLADEGERGPGWIDRQVAARVGCSGRLVEMIPKMNRELNREMNRKMIRKIIRGSSVSKKGIRCTRDLMIRPIP